MVDPEVFKTVHYDTEKLRALPLVSVWRELRCSNMAYRIFVCFSRTTGDSWSSFNLFKSVVVNIYVNQSQVVEGLY